MQLWIDLGNTRLKWLLEQNDEIIGSGAITHDGNELATCGQLKMDLASISGKNLDFIGAASVLGNESDALYASELSALFGLPPQFAKVQKEFNGFVCAYDDVGKLGVDRWLATYAAFVEQGCPVLVISFGSAITIDACDALGRHLGGYILPGLNMARGALLGKTASVRFQNALEQGQEALDSVEYGRDTSSAVNHGLLFQACATVNEAVRVFLEKHHNGVALVTGGNALQVKRFLKVDVRHREGLVLTGLQQYFTGQ